MVSHLAARDTRDLPPRRRRARRHTVRPTHAIQRYQAGYPVGLDDQVNSGTALLPPRRCRPLVRLFCLQRGCSGLRTVACRAFGCPLSADSRVVFALQSMTCVTIVGPAPRLIDWWRTRYDSRPQDLIHYALLERLRQSGTRSDRRPQRGAGSPGDSGRAFRMGQRRVGCVTSAVDVTCH